MKNIPFIHLLKSPNYMYFFDVNRNTIQTVSNELYEYLYAVLHECDLPVLSSVGEVELAKLKTKGFLSPHRVKTLQHPAIRTLRHSLGRKLQKLTLQVTQNCNLRCHYCTFANDNGKHRIHSEKAMSWDTAKKLVDFLHAHSLDSEEVNISFYGGEPLLAFELIKQVVEYAQKIFCGKPITFSATTNGTLLTSEMLDFFAQHNVMLVISLDGLKNNHDVNRRFSESRQGSFDTIMENLHFAKEKNPEYFQTIMFHMVVDPSQPEIVSSMAKHYPLIKDSTIKASFVDTLYLDDDYLQQGDSRASFWRYSYHNFLALLEIYGRFPKKDVALISRNLVRERLGEIKKWSTHGRLPDVGAPSGPCVPGLLRLFANTEGVFYPCETVSEVNPCFVIGNVDEGFNYEQCEKILRISEMTPEQCINCFAFAHCGMCARRCANENGYSHEMKLRECSYTKQDFEMQLKMFILLRELSSVYHYQEPSR